jgi:arginase family enzyme
VHCLLGEARGRLPGTPGVRGGVGLGAEPGGLTSAQVRRIVTDARAVADVVGFTVPEYFPRQVMHMEQILEGLSPDQ